MARPDIPQPQPNPNFWNKQLAFLDGVPAFNGFVDAQGIEPTTLPAWQSPDQRSWKYVGRGIEKSVTPMVHPQFVELIDTTYSWNQKPHNIECTREIQERLHNGSIEGKATYSQQTIRPDSKLFTYTPSFSLSYRYSEGDKGHQPKDIRLTMGIEPETQLFTAFYDSTGKLRAVGFLTDNTQNLLEEALYLDGQYGERYAKAEFMDEKANIEDELEIQKDEMDELRELSYVRLFPGENGVAYQEYLSNHMGFEDEVEIGEEPDSTFGFVDIMEGDGEDDPEQTVYISSQDALKTAPHAQYEQRIKLRNSDILARISEEGLLVVTSEYRNGTNNEDILAAIPMNLDIETFGKTLSSKDDLAHDDITAQFRTNVIFPKFGTSVSTFPKAA